MKTEATFISLLFGWGISARILEQLNERMKAQPVQGQCQYMLFWNQITADGVCYLGRNNLPHGESYPGR